MPVGNFMYNIAKYHFAVTAGDLPGPVPSRMWDHPPTVGGLGEYRMLFVCGGGAANGLDLPSAVNLSTLAATTVIPWLFDGQGINAQLGVALPTRSVDIDTTAETSRLLFSSFTLQNVAAGTPPNNHSITDLLVVWTRSGGVGPLPDPTASLMIARFDISASPVVPDGRGVQIVCPTAGLVYVD